MQGQQIDGKKIADEILDELRQEIVSKHLHPHMVVFLVGDNHSSQSYIRQKKKTAERIGALCTVLQFPDTITPKEFQQEINKANKQSNIHGIIIQRPLPVEASLLSSLLSTIELSKDIDGFLPNSPYEVPVSKAVLTILEYTYHNHYSQNAKDFLSWLRSQDVVVIGKGVTAGGPIRNILVKLDVPVVGIDQSTLDPQKIMKKAEIIISCVGKEHAVSTSNIAQGVILISVGLTRGTDGKIHGDYEEKDIQEKAQFYTPTPGGVGPVNVACLMQNLVKASKLK